MSKQSHTNINAAGFYGDIVVAFLNRLCGPAAEPTERARAMEIISVNLPLFVARVSGMLDMEFAPICERKDETI